MISAVGAHCVRVLRTGISALWIPPSSSRVVIWQSRCGGVQRRGTGSQVALKTEDFKALYEKCAANLKGNGDTLVLYGKIITATEDTLAATKNALAIATKALAMSERETTVTRELLEASREYSALATGILVSRSILENIAHFKNSALAEKSCTAALRQVATDKAFMEYLVIVGNAAGFTANELSNAVMQGYSDVSTCIHRSVVVARPTTVVPTAIFHRTVTAVAVHAVFLFYGHHVGGRNITFVNLDSSVLVIPRPPHGPLLLTAPKISAPKA